MTHDRFAAFWLAMLWNAARIGWPRIKAFYIEQIRRYVDRYYRIGRHSTRAQGLLHGRWAMDIVASLRGQRDLHSHRIPA